MNRYARLVAPGRSPGGRAGGEVRLLVYAIFNALQYESTEESKKVTFCQTANWLKVGVGGHGRKVKVFQRLGIGNCADWPALQKTGLKARRRFANKDSIPKSTGIPSGGSPGVMVSATGAKPAGKT